MNKFQKICLLFSILTGIDFAFYTLLNISFLLRFLNDSSIWYKLYAFFIGISAFTNLLLMKQDD